MALSPASRKALESARDDLNAALEYERVQILRLQSELIRAQNRAAELYGQLVAVETDLTGC